MRGCLQAALQVMDLQIARLVWRPCMNVSIDYYSSLLSGVSMGGYRAGCIDRF